MALTEFWIGNKIPYPFSLKDPDEDIADDKECIVEEEEDSGVPAHVYTHPPSPLVGYGEGMDADAQPPSLVTDTGEPTSVGAHPPPPLVGSGEPQEGAVDVPEEEEVHPASVPSQCSFDGERGPHCHVCEPQPQPSRKYQEQLVRPVQSARFWTALLPKPHQCIIL